MRSTPPHAIDHLSPQATHMQFSQRSLFETDTPANNPISQGQDSLSTPSTTPPPHRYPTSAFPAMNQPRMNSYPSLFNSVLTMPIPGTKLSTEKVRGNFHKVKDFVHHYERLCAQNNVTDDAEKCETLLRYCSKREKQTIKNIPSFVSKSWGRLREDILKLYDADLDATRYKVKDVRNFSKKQKGKKIRDLAGWKKYCRAFLRIAGALLSERRITQGEYATYFWQGIPKPLRIRLENRILASNPIRDLSEPFGVEEIDTAASAILQRDRFDHALDDSESEEEDSSAGESSSESEEDSSDSESEDEREKRRRRAKKKSRNRSGSRGSKKHTMDRLEDKLDTGKKRTVSGSRKEVESLIKHMNLLTRDDPEYGITYYRALKLDPDIARIVAEPCLRQPQNQRYAPSNPMPSSSTYQQSVFQQPPPAGTNVFRNPSAFRTAPPSQPPPRGSEMICYGCGEKGHGITRCPHISDLLEKGILAKDFAGRIVYKDGSPIKRRPDETYIQAYEREQRGQYPQSHFVMIANDSDNEGYLSDTEEEDFKPNQEDIQDWYSDHEDVFAIRDINSQTYGVERPEKSIATRKKMVLDGVYPPRIKDILPGKENRPTDSNTGRPIRPGKQQVAKPSTSSNVPVEVSKPKKAPEPIPVEVHAPRYDASKDSQIIEDDQRKKKHVQKRPQDELPEMAKLIEKRPAKQSAISEHVSVLNVLDQVLNTKVELAIGEVIGVSRELSGQLANAIKFKSHNKPTEVALTTLGNGSRAKTRGLLIKIMVECDGKPIQAIIDTGSQLNIVSERICKSKIQRPIDCTATVSMNDANGGQGKIEGIVEDVPLDYGSVRTRANLYVGQHVPFDLLLGRPWQRGNLVSIDEHDDGTYLIFKDPNTLEPRHKVLVTPDAIVTEGWDYDPSTWLASRNELEAYVVSVGDASPGTGASKSISPDSKLGHRTKKFPNLDKWAHPEFQAHRNASPFLKAFKERIITSASRIFKKGPQKVLAKYKNSDIKERLASTKVQHDTELAPPLSLSTTSQHEAERPLAGLGNIPQSHNQHLRDVTLMSHDGIVIGHCTDDSGL